MRELVAWSRLQAGLMNVGFLRRSRLLTFGPRLSPPTDGNANDDNSISKSR